MAAGENAGGCDKTTLRHRRQAYGPIDDVGSETRYLALQSLPSSSRRKNQLRKAMGQVLPETDLRVRRDGRVQILGWDSYQNHSGLGLRYLVGKVHAKR